MNKLLYLSEEEVQSQLATKYTLLVHVGLETFQYAIIDNVHGKVKVLAEYEIPEFIHIKELINAIEGLSESSRQFKFSFNTVKISFDTSNYTFIPADLYREESREEYGKYIRLAETGELLVNSLASSEIKNVVAIDSDFNKALNRVFHRPKIYNQAAPFLEGVQKSLKREDEVVCFIDIHPRHFQFALFKDFRLEFYNSFEYANADEFNYYLLNVIDSLNIDTDQTPVILSGKISASDEVYKRILKYFESIRFIESEHLMKYSATLDEVQSYTFFSLFSLNLCE